MAGILITSLLSLATNLLPSITASAQAPSSSSNSNNSEKGRARAVEEELERLMRTLERIKATLYDAEEREIRDRSVKLWLKELKKVAYDAEDVLSEYRYEVTRVQVKARKASQARKARKGSHKRKQMEYIVSIHNGMVDRLKKIRRQFDEIALQLSESDGVRRPNYKIVRPPTGHMVDETSIFGRDAEITEVIDILLTEKEKSFSVISIVGKCGIGKTTIAQLVYKNERVSQCFDLFGWVGVSEDFDVSKLIKATLESVFKNYYSLNELRLLQEMLAQTVKGKTILLVLDDVCNENQTLWELFQVPFKEAKLVRILVTTRNKKVADVMQTTACFRPTNLPEDSCWQLFQHYAFSGTSDTMPKHLVDLRRKIMSKCGGLPLAVKSIASILRHEIDEESWSRDILESELWGLNPLNDIFPELQISYDHLPPHLKPCFLFCSMYPKDYLLEKENLIELWISHGYIESKGKRRIEEIAGGYYEELKERSFLDCSDRSSEHCKLHDMIHDLARHNSENEHYSLEINQPLNTREGTVPREAYHLYASGFIGYVNQILQQNLKGLRTLSTDLRACYTNLEQKYCINNTEAMDLSDDEECWDLSDDKECLNVHICNLTKFEALRVLDLKGDDLTRIPDSISELKHLAYLSITSSDLKMLPLSIGLLYNLQTLILDCDSLEYLPESIGDLLNLQFLNIKSSNLRNLPTSLGSLSNLLRLVITSSCLKMLPLSIGLLYNLQTLILDCDSLEYLPESIGDFLNLHYLSITSSDLTMLPLSIGLLYNLQTLILDCDSLEYLPESIGDFLNLHYLSITSSDLTMLPLSIGLLYNLQTLILDCDSLEYLPESIGDFLNLHYLSITSSDLTMLPLSIGLLYNLQTLILDCDSLEYLPESIGDLLNLLFLKIQSSNLRNLPTSLGSLSGLLRLVIIGENFLDYVPHGLVNFPAIKTMRAQLRVRTVAWLKDMTNLEGNLSINGVRNLEDVPCANLRNKCKLETLDLCWRVSNSYRPNLIEKSDLTLTPTLEASEDEWDGVDDADFSLLESLQPHPNLKELQLRYYPSATLPGWMRDPSSLQSIQEILLEECDNIQSLPFNNLHTLKHLKIDKCDSIRVLQLPSQLEVLNIRGCDQLELITGLGNLDMLTTLKIYLCKVLKSIRMDGLQLVESTRWIDSSKEIRFCELLCVLPDGLIPSGPCCHVMSGCCGCPHLKIGDINGLFRWL